MAKRLVGAAVVRMQYQDARSSYHCTISVRGLHCYTCEVRPPAGSGHFNDVGFGIGVAVDAPEAYDQVAGTAIAFGADDGEFGNDAEHAGIIREATDWAIDKDGSYNVRRFPRKRGGTEPEIERLRRLT
jgi:hypothetical protein